LGARVKSPLTDLENAVMGAVWDSGPCSVEAVYQVVSRTRDLKETTVRTLLRRLEQKGCIGPPSRRAASRRGPFGKSSIDSVRDRSKSS
jgi:predicted transcriptional regulator